MKIKIIIGVLAALVVLFVVVVLIIGAHLGDIVKAGMEVEGPKVTQTTLTVDSVSVSLLGGSAGMKNFVLGNPDGYKAAQCITFSNAAIGLAPGSVMSDKIVIHSVEVRGLEVTFEGNPLGANNLTQIMANVQGTSDSSSANANAPPPQSPAQPATPAGPAKPGKKFEVDDLVISGAKVHANITGIINKELTLPLPDIHMSGLGTGPDGVTGSELIKAVLTEISVDSIKALISSVNGLGSQLGDTAKQALQNGTAGAGDGLKNLKQGLGGLLGK
jgi:hypothetical protein